MSQPPSAPAHPKSDAPTAGLRAAPLVVSKSIPTTPTQDLPIDPRFGPNKASLLRLFKSEFFNEWLTIYYLFKYPDNDGIQDYLCEQMANFSQETILEYLPQLIHILVTHVPMPRLESFLVSRCGECSHLALLTMWYIECYLADLAEHPTSPSFKLCTRLLASLEHVCSFHPTEPPAPPPPQTDTEEPSLARTPPPPRAAPPRAVATPPTTTAAGALLAVDTRGRAGGGVAGAHLLKTSPSLDDLHQGRLFSFTYFCTLLATPTTPAPLLPFTLPTSSSFPASFASFPFSVNDTSPTTLAHSPSGTPDGDAPLRTAYYFYCVKQFFLALSNIGRRLESVHKEARQSTLTAELALLNHNFPAPVCLPLWCPHHIHHHTLLQINPNEAVILNSAERAPFFLLVETSNPHVVPATPHASLPPPMPMPVPLETPAPPVPVGLAPRPAFTAAPPAARPGALKKSPSESSRLSLPGVGSGSGGVGLPGVTGGSATTSLVGTPASAVANPFMDAEFAERMKTAAILLAQLDSQEKLLTESRKGAAAAGSGGGGGGGGGSGSEGKRATAFSSLKQHLQKYTRARSTPTSPTSPADYASGKKRAEKTAPTELIRQRILKEMMHFEEQRLALFKTTTEMQRPVGASSGGTDRVRTHSSPPSPLASVSTPQLTADKEDPSGAVFRESWERKTQRIRATSRFGAEPHWQLLSVIVKTGADLRQEQLAGQLMREIQKIWVAENVPCYLRPYRVLVAGHAQGLIETLTNTISLHSLKKAHARSETVFTLNDFFVQEFGPVGSPGYTRAQINFAMSLAGYSLLSYLLNVKDRHNGNILLDYTSGHVVHIDFGFMLSNSPGRVGFETAPFKFANEYLEVLQGYHAEPFRAFKRAMVQGLLSLKRHHEKLVGMVEIMEKDSPLDCFTYSSLRPVENEGSVSVVQALRERLLIGAAESQVVECVDKLIASALGNVFTRLYDGYQYYTQGVMA